MKYDWVGWNLNRNRKVLRWSLWSRKHLRSFHSLLMFSSHYANWYDHLMVIHLRSRFSSIGCQLKKSISMFLTMGGESGMLAAFRHLRFYLDLPRRDPGQPVRYASSSHCERPVGHGEQSHPGSACGTLGLGSGCAQPGNFSCAAR